MDGDGTFECVLCGHTMPMFTDEAYTHMLAHRDAFKGQGMTDAEANAEVFRRIKEFGDAPATTRVKRELSEMKWDEEVIY